jgi:hypothetical protein
MKRQLVEHKIEELKQLYTKGEEMKRIIYTVALVSLFVSGCGEDRSHSDSGLSLFGSGTKWIYDTASGKEMVKNNFTYIPGGFDVDGDGENEGGFWISLYEARENGSIEDLDTVGNINLIRDTFRVYDANTKMFDKVLDRDFLQNIDLKNSLKVKFADNGNVANNLTPIEAVVAIKNSQIDGGVKIGLPSEKQWMHIVKLVVNNPKNWTEGEVGKGKLFQGNKYSDDDRRFFVIENSLLGEDPNVPDDYKTDVYDLSGNYAEWTSGMVALTEKIDVQKDGDIPKFWQTELKNGTVLSTTSDIGAGQYQSSTHYVVVARGGSQFESDDSLVGINAVQLKYDLYQSDQAIGFRATSAYLY